jgi:hypothetical protein
MSDQGTTRREVLTKAVYVTPLLITLKATLAFAATGSGLGGVTPPPVSDPAPAGHTGSDAAASPPQDEQVTDHPGTRRWSRHHPRWHIR